MGAADRIIKAPCGKTTHGRINECKGLPRPESTRVRRLKVCFSQQLEKGKSWGKNVIRGDRLGKERLFAGTASMGMAPCVLRKTCRGLGDGGRRTANRHVGRVRSVLGSLTSGHDDSAWGHTVKLMARGSSRLIARMAKKTAMMPKRSAKRGSPSMLRADQDARASRRSCVTPRAPVIIEERTATINRCAAAGGIRLRAAAKTSRGGAVVPRSASALAAPRTARAIRDLREHLRV